MNPSLKIRHQVEAALAERIPSALSPRMQPHRESFATGIEEIDTLLHGGLPVGALTELVGMQGSGRTTLALSFVSGVTRQGNVCAWIDASDVLDPESAAASGVDLDRLLWVRCGDGSIAAEERSSSNVTEASANVVSTMPSFHGGSPHPRGESRGMPQAVSALFQASTPRSGLPVQGRDKSIGTPGRKNRPADSDERVDRSQQSTEDREEQVAYDRLSPRRGESVVAKRSFEPSWEPRCAEPQHGRRREPYKESVSSKQFLPVDWHRSGTPAKKIVWKQIDQALRATDLLLQAGGFSALVLDLGSIPAEYVWKIPLAKWFRFRTAAERSHTSILLLTQHPCARSSAELVLQMTTGTMTSDGGVLSAMSYQVEVSRKRFEGVPDSVIPIRKPPQPERRATWMSEAVWVRHG